MPLLHMPLLHLPLKSPVAEPMDCMVRSTFSSNHSSAGSHVTLQSHTSHVTLKVTRHTSHVKRHTSHVTHHTSHVTRHTSPDCSRVMISAVLLVQNMRKTRVKTKKQQKMKRDKGKAGAAGWGARSVLDHCFFDHGVQHFAGLLRMRFEV